MAVKHTFVSSTPDGSDASLVRPSNWNDSHTVDDNTFVAAKLSVAVANILFGGTATGAATEIALTANTFLARSSSGNIAAKSITDAALTVLDDTTVSAMVDTLGGASAVGTGGLVRDTGVISRPLTGYVAALGTVAATDTILQAIQKVDGNATAFAQSARLISTGETYEVVAGRQMLFTLDIINDGDFINDGDVIEVS